MMQWKKLGLVYKAAEHVLPWAKNSALVPHAILLDEKTIRVYFGARDEKGVSRLRYADVSASDPTKLLAVSQEPVLDIGRPGCFDDNGMVMGDIFQMNGEFYMTYVGFQLATKAKFLAFSGLAKSSDGKKFTRCGEAPFMDRANEGCMIRAIHTIFHENGKWKIWYSLGDGWEIINGKPFPQYQINYCETEDLFNIPKQGQAVILPERKEYRIGRPRVFSRKGKYHMTFTFGTTDGEYTTGYASSKDGLHWERNDSELGIGVSEEGWDAKHFAYPSFVEAGGKAYIFYNGNDMGIDGFGCAELIKE